MNYITYDEGVDMTLNWDYEKLLCVAFVEEGCDACDSFFDLNHINVYLFLNTLLKKLYFKIVFIESNFPIE